QLDHYQPDCKPASTLLIKGTNPSGPLSQSFICTEVMLLLLKTCLTISSRFSSSIPAPMITALIAFLFFSKTFFTPGKSAAAKYSASFMINSSGGGMLVSILPTSNIFFIYQNYERKFIARAKKFAICNLQCSSGLANHIS